MGTPDAPPQRKSPFAFFKSEQPSKGDTFLKGDDTHWGSNRGSSDGEGEMIWNEAIADALGYGKKGHPGAAFQWWIPVVATLCCIGSFIAWAVLVVRGRDATDVAMQILGVDFPWWHSVKSLLIATAVLYPVLVALAVIVSAWRAYLAKTLDIHRPNARWLRSCRRFQGLSAAAHTLLWLLVLIIVFSVAGHAVWGYVARIMDLVGTKAVQLVGPVWNSVSRVADSSRELTDRFTGMLDSLPAIGRRLAEASPGDAGAGTVGSLLAAGGAVRQLQQADGLLSGLGQLAGTIANGLGAAAQAIPAAIPGLPANITIPGLPQLLPNGSSNPLVGAIKDVVDSVENQLLSPSGCPIYCIDLRTESWWVDESAGCFCNMDRIEAALPYLRQAWRAIMPAVLALVFMYIGASWLLMHGAAQWARTRSEAKLMARIPGAAAAQAAANKAAAASRPSDAGAPPAPLATV